MKTVNTPTENNQPTLTDDEYIKMTAPYYSDLASALDSIIDPPQVVSDADRILIEYYFGQPELELQFHPCGIKLSGDDYITSLDLPILSLMFETEHARDTLTAQRIQAAYIYLLMLDDQWSEVKRAILRIEQAKEIAIQKKVIAQIKEINADTCAKLDHMIECIHRDAPREAILVAEQKIDALIKSLEDLRQMSYVAENHPGEESAYINYLSETYPDIYEEVYGATC